MEKLGIRVGDEGTATFFFEPMHVQPTTVTEGMVNVLYLHRLAEDLPQNSTLSGRLIFGERVYGRLTRVRSEDGSVNIPVCLEIWDRQGGRGLIDLGKRGPTTATVLSTVNVRAVREFK
jgi:serine/threonine-protein kinase